MSSQIFIGQANGENLYLNPKYANRHGLIAGATGTGKTVTLQGLAESFSDIGVPVFLADVKGDLSGLGCIGDKLHPKVEERIKTLGMEPYEKRGYPVEFWDMFGASGKPVRTTIAEMGPQLLSRLIDLNDTQEGILTLCFEYTEDEKLPLLDLKDLNSTLEYLRDEGKQIGGPYARLSKASIAAIQRRLLTLERDGGDVFFGETALDYKDLIQCSEDGRGQINILAANKLIQSPRIYSTFLLWLLAELFDELPEVGDQDKPKFVFFFDEAHLLFKDTPKVFIEKVEQVVRLIRSKGVGIFFISQSPGDIPDRILSQLGSRVQHALRAYTPKERKVVRAASQSFRSNPDLDTETMITEMGVGEALVSVLQDKGIPSVVEHTLIRPPYSRIGPLTEPERDVIIQQSPYKESYGESIDRESAHEILTTRLADKERQEQEELEQEKEQKKEQAESKAKYKRASLKKKTGRRSNRQGIFESFFKSLVRQLGSGLGRKLLRTIVNVLLRK